MPDKVDVEKMVSRIEGCISDLFRKANDDSWVKWSEYVPKAIEQISMDINRLHEFREKMLVDLTEVKLTTEKIENTIEKILIEIKVDSRRLDEYKEKTIAPLKLKVAVFSIISGLVGGALAMVVPTLLRVFLS